MTCGAQWRAIGREAELAAEQIALGVTALGRANHAATGLYHQAFFGLSIGLERMGKLIVIADHAISNRGQFPSDKELRKVGHDLTALLPRCESIGRPFDSTGEFAKRPTDEIHQGIEEALSMFATGLRYYNLDYLAGVSTEGEDPIAVWWLKVAKPICERHYTPRAKARDARNAAAFERLVGDSTFIMHTAENGAAIRDASSFASRAVMTSVIQRYGRLYSLQIVRWLTHIIRELASIGAYRQRIEALLGLHEPFAIFLNDNEMFMRRKAWSIYRP